MFSNVDRLHQLQNLDRKIGRISFANGRAMDNVKCFGNITSL